MTTRWLCLASLAPLIALSGCSGGPAFAAQPPQAPLLGPSRPVLVGADRVTLLRSGRATFAVLRDLIARARRAVDVEVYEFGQRPLADALVADAHRGVAVSVIDDPSETASAMTADRLRPAGVAVVDYPVRSLMIDHVKLLVVDSQVAVVGGINWGVNSPANHDYDAEIRGPAVHNLERVFLRDLVTCGRPGGVPDPIPDRALLVAATLPGQEIRPLALGLINAAVHSLHLELFVLTDTGIVHALIAAAHRGVEISVLLDPTQPSSMPSFLTLTAAGVDVRWYRSHGELLHAKAVVSDGSAVLFGSANWSGGGFARNHELDIELPDAPSVAQAMLAQMSLDWAASA